MIVSSAPPTPDPTCTDINDSIRNRATSTERKMHNFAVFFIACLSAGATSLSTVTGEGGIIYFSVAVSNAPAANFFCWDHPSRDDAHTWRRAAQVHAVPCGYVTTSVH